MLVFVYFSHQTIWDTGLIRGVHMSDIIAQLMSDIPMQFPVQEQKEDSFNCRVWVREALRVPEDYGVIAIGYINKLEEKFNSPGEENDSSIVGGGSFLKYTVQITTRMLCDTNGWLQLPLCLK